MLTYENDFKPLLRGVRSLDDIAEATIPYLKNARLEHGRLGYISGMVTSQGELWMPSNRFRLSIWTKAIALGAPYPTFSCEEMFKPKTYTDISKNGKLPKEQDFHVFWRRIMIESGVTDFFRTPFDSLSRGAHDERFIAWAMGMRVHDLYA